MDMIDIITRKRDGKELRPEEIEYFVKGMVKGRIPDYQTTALLMAIYFQKLTDNETVKLTQEMAESGDTMDLSEIPGIKVDKHSTGGVGDKTTLIVGPIAAACGVPIAKMSGRGLGFTGGTIDKLESIPGFKSSLSKERFINQVEAIGLAIAGQTESVTPADKKLYALRDVTGTVENKSLIASSIMSKKLASGADAIVLDVKCGRGAFMTDIDEAIELSRIMCDIGNNAGKRTVAVLSDMDQPLGLKIGNSLEVQEAVDVLKNQGPADITMLSLALAGLMILAGGKAETLDEGIRLASEAIADGSALGKFRDMIKLQDGDDSVLDDFSLFPQPRHALEVRMSSRASEFAKVMNMMDEEDEAEENAEESPFANYDDINIEEKIRKHHKKYITRIDAQMIGEASRICGAGRETVDDKIDPAAGIELRKKAGDEVKVGDIIAILYGSDGKKLAEAEKLVKEAFEIGRKEPERMSMIYEMIGVDKQTGTLK